ncbi:MAG TPA: SCO2322 family protein [Nocardioides sp.]|uniref:SCO2322 family protein n=1 Tax=Nocardioides sp. TaxID=35761 RepID=UPI002D800695|nr:SCO2322 family protein [Nocardioides sp.]HET6654034.1 SCO2322 family protein [Nocardioides sp.]
MATSHRRVVGVLLTALLSLFAVLAGAGPSYAEDGFRYWNYSHLQGDTFEFAQTGPGDFTPKEGDVEGWRFGTSTVATGIAPRADLAEVNFDTVCGDAEAATGEKRVAVLVDYGTEADADGAEIPDPVAECAVVPEDANGQQTLESVVDLRTAQSMICALDGYPAKGCGDPVGDAQVEAEEATVAFVLPAAADESTTSAGDDTVEEAAEEDQGMSPALIAVLVVIALLAVAAVPLYRRNRES